ncbi:MAG: hypothetical protein OXI29_12165 [bacterium]|nr:hypothetical protein [bacterium]
MNWDETGRSYTHNFLPFVCHCLSTSGQDEVSDADICESLLEEFGIELPRPVIRTIMKRAAKEGLVEREGGQYRLDRQRLNTYSLDDKRDSLMDSYEKLVNTFVDYSNERYGLVVPTSEAEDLLLNYITERSLPILRASIRGQAIATEDSPSHQRMFAINQFVIEMYESGNPLFSVIEAIVKGSMLASSIYLPDYNSPGRRINDLEIYLDTPFLVDLIGLAREPEREAAKELFELLRSLGAEFACFEHTLYETQGVIRNASQQLKSPNRNSNSRRAYSPIANYCIEANMRSSDLAVRADNLQGELARLNIQVKETPPHSPALTVDEMELDQILQFEVNYLSDATKQKDLQSITAIHRIRGGKEKQHLENAKAIFVTPNRKLARASQLFFGEVPRGDRVPICSFDSEIATVAWIKKPTAAPDLARKQLIADCYSSIYPSDALWAKYLDEIDRLSESDNFSEEDYFVLRYSVEATRALMDETLGDSEEVSAEAVQRILNNARENARSEIVEKYDEVLREKQDAIAQVNQLDGELEGERTSRRREREGVEQFLLAQSKRFARRVVYATIGTIGVLLIALAILVPLLIGTSALVKGLSPLGTGVVFGVPTYQMLFGSSHKGLFTGLSSKLRKIIGDWKFGRLMAALDAEGGQP